MSPESKVERGSSLNLRTLVSHENGSWCLAPKGRLVLQLVRASVTLLHDEDPKIPFAISPQYREQLVAERNQIAKSLGIDPEDHRTQKRIGKKIQQRTGFSYYDIQSSS